VMVVIVKVAEAHRAMVGERGLEVMNGGNLPLESNGTKVTKVMYMLVQILLLVQRVAF
jgi:hypothetical protein